MYIWLYEQTNTTNRDGMASMRYQSIEPGTHQIKVLAKGLNLSECPNGAKDGEAGYTLTTTE